jgi:hypothetical protein
MWPRSTAAERLQARVLRTHAQALASAKPRGTAAPIRCFTRTLPQRTGKRFPVHNSCARKFMQLMPGGIISLARGTEARAHDSAHGRATQHAGFADH